MKPANLKYGLLGIICICSLSLSAQSSIKNGEHKTKNHVFIVTESKKEKLTIKSVSEKSELIPSGDNKFKPGERFEYNGNQLASQDNIHTSFIKVLGMKRIKEIPNDKAILVNVRINRQGKILMLAYVDTKNTDLTLEKFDQLTTYIKKMFLI